MNPKHTWMNGSIRPWEESLIHVGSDAVLRGASVFEASDVVEVIGERRRPRNQRMWKPESEILRTEVHVTPPAAAR